jgi:phospholipid/cholesterol/gamma-HCH transport system substrate-binding protein
MSEFYKDQRKVELRVGIITIASIIILIVGYAWLKNTLQLKTQTEIMIRFESAQGIEIGDKVTVNGMEAGSIRKISQLQDGVLVHTRLKLKHPIRQGAKFIIQDSNLMGGKQLEIINSKEGDPIDLNVVQDGDNSYGMTALMSNASVTLQQINSLFEEINNPEGVFAQIKETFEETKETFTKINDTIDDSRGNLNHALQQISSSAEHLNDLLSRNKTKLDETINMTPDLLAKTTATMDSLRLASSSLQEILKDMSEGKGTLPSLINDDTLYKNLLNSTAKLDSLLTDVKKNPGRYFKVRVF